MLRSIVLCGILNDRNWAIKQKCFSRVKSVFNTRASHYLNEFGSVIHDYVLNKSSLLSGRACSHDFGIKSLLLYN